MLGIAGGQNIGWGVLHAVSHGSLPTGKWAFFRRLDDGSRMSREVHVRFCEQRRGKFPPLTLLVIAAWGGGQHILKELRRMLSRLKLELSEEKTRVVKAKEGFDFLGVHFKLCPITTPGKKREQVCRVWPSDRSMKRIREKIRTKIGRRYSKSLEEMIEELNPVLRGWHNYHKAVDPYPCRILNLNRYVWDRLRIFLRRKYNDDTRGCRRLRGGLLTSLGVYPFA